MRTRLFLCLVLLALAAANAGAADVTGTWTVTLTLPNETIIGVAVLKENGDKVTGSIGANEQNQHPLDGVVEGNRITLTTHPRPGRTVAFAKCYLTANGEKLTGKTEGGDFGDKIAAIEFARAKK